MWQRQRSYGRVPTGRWRSSQEVPAKLIIVENAVDIGTPYAPVGLSQTVQFVGRLPAATDDPKERLRRSSGNAPSHMDFIAETRLHRGERKSRRDARNTAST